MNILLATRVFYPSVGGMETVALQLAKKWEEKGHIVQVVTETPLEDHDSSSELNVFRNPSLTDWKELLDGADIFVQSGISLKSLPFGLLVLKPIVIIHHNMLPVSWSSIGIRMLLKRWATHLVFNVAVSSAVARDIPSSKKIVIYNPFEPHFDIEFTAKNKYNLLFVGRLVSVKGCDVALRALSKLNGMYKLTVCGDGPELEELMKLTSKLNITDRVEFKGWVNHDELAYIAKEASIQLIPSRYEPFGIVALEAIAANCAVVASNTGGLPEAVGSCGILVPKDDPHALADGIMKATGDKEHLLSKRTEHLINFNVEKIAQKYLDAFKDLVNSK